MNAHIANYVLVFTESNHNTRLVLIIGQENERKITMEISDEEKARVLSIKGSCGAYVTAQVEQLLPTAETKERISIYGACMEAMQWKNEQHKQEKQQWINKVCEWINEQSFGGWIDEPTDEFIEELVKAMKGE